MSHPEEYVAAAVAAAVAAVVVDDDDHRRDRDPHAVHVKPEYVVSERPSCLAAPPPLPPSSSSSAISSIEANGGGRDNSGGGAGGGKNKNNRGTNKKRPRDAKVDNIDKACQSIVRGEICPYQLSSGKCKYNHDLKGMLENRPTDLHEGDDGASWLDGMCPSWIDRG